MKLRKNVIKHIWQPIEDKELLTPLFNEQNYKLSVKTNIKATDNYVYYTFNSLPDNVMLTFCYDTLWDYDQHGCRIRMFLELQGEMIGFAQSHAQELKNLKIEPDKVPNNSSWWHFRGTDIHFTPQELIKPNVIVEKIITGIKDSGFYEMGIGIINLKKESH